MGFQLECEDFDYHHYHAAITQVWCDKHDSNGKNQRNPLCRMKIMRFIYTIGKLFNGKGIGDGNGNVKAVRQDYSFRCMVKLSNHCYIILCVCVCVCGCDELACWTGPMLSAWHEKVFFYTRLICKEHWVDCAWNSLFPSVIFMITIW